MDEEEKLLEFRKTKDWHWKHDAESPLTEDQKRKFTGLSYFPYNPKLRFVLTLDKNIPNVGEKVVIETTKGDKQVYLRAGKVLFRVDEKDVEAVILEDPEQEQYQYYLLFKDETTGKETYENGRMLQIETRSASSGQEELIVDFNYAYNPYSSYNDNWDCPITPQENFLPVRVEVGEKRFK